MLLCEKRNNVLQITTFTSLDNDFRPHQKIICYNYFSSKNSDSFDKIFLYTNKTSKSKRVGTINETQTTYIFFFLFLPFPKQTHTHTHTHIYIYIYIYILKWIGPQEKISHIYREREKERRRERKENTNRQTRSISFAFRQATWHSCRVIRCLLNAWSQGVDGCTYFEGFDLFFGVWGTLIQECRWS